MRRPLLAPSAERSWPENASTILVIIVLFLLTSLILGTLGLVFALTRNGGTTTTTTTSYLSIADCSSGLPYACTALTLDAVVLCNDTRTLYQCSANDTWISVGNFNSTTTTPIPDGSDGAVLAWDVNTGAWVARVNPVYYGTGTQSLSGLNAVTMGELAQTIGSPEATAVGHQAVGSNVGAAAYGSNAVAHGAGTVAMGQNSLAGSGAGQSISIGYNSTSQGPGATGIGPRVFNSAQCGVAVGELAVATGIQSIVVGSFSQCTGSYALVAGYQSSNAGIDNAIVLGASTAPLDGAHALALSLPASSVLPATLGITLNGAAAVVEHYGSLYATTAGAGPTVLTLNSAKIQVFTTAQTVTLPVTSTLQLGFSRLIINSSGGGSVVVQSSGANTKITLLSGEAAHLTCILTSGTTAASWMAVGPIPAT